MKMFEQAAEAIRAQGDLEKLREMYRIPGKELVLFGAGECGHKVYEILQEAGVGVSCFCDNRMGGQTDPATGLVITAPETLDTNKEAMIVLICVVERSIYTSIYGQLSDMGFVDEQIRDMGEYFFRLPLTYFEKNISDVQHCRDCKSE